MKRLIDRFRRRLDDRIVKYAAQRNVLGDRIVEHAALRVPGPVRDRWLRRFLEFDVVDERPPDHTLTDLLREALSIRIEPDERFHLPGLQRRETEPLNTWTYQNQRMQFDIHPSHRVLDVGSGAYPFNQATHLADRYPGETSHRVGALRRDERPFVVMDVQHMPFRDREWDFTFCSHVLEHLDQPGDACRELMRVSARGYIEVPTKLSDVMLNFTRLTGHHRWHGAVLGHTLVLIEWTDQERRDVGTNFFYQCLHSRYHNAFQTLFEQNWSVFFGMLHWKERFDFMVVDKFGRIVDQSTGSGQGASPAPGTVT